MTQNESTVWFSSEEIQAKLSETKFKPFDDSDWQTFAGAESEQPWIFYGDKSSSELVLILDDTHVEAYVTQNYSYGPTVVTVDFESLTDAVDFAILFSRKKQFNVVNV